MLLLVEMINGYWDPSHRAGRPSFCADIDFFNMISSFDIIKCVFDVVMIPPVYVYHKIYIYIIETYIILYNIVLHNIMQYIL